MSIILDERFRESRGSFLVRLIEQDIQDNLPRYRKVRQYRSLYFGTATADMPLPWPGASNIHLPVLMEKVETFVPMVMSAFWGIEPVVNVRRSPDEYNPEQTDEVEQFMNFIVTKDIVNFYETFETWLRSTGIDSMSHLSPNWERKMRYVSVMHTLKRVYEADEQMASGQKAVEAREKTSLELLIEIFGPIGATNGLLDAQPLRGTDEDAAVGTIWSVAFIEDRVPYRAEVSFIPGIHIDEVRAQVRRKIIEREGAAVDVLEYEDLVLPYRAQNVQDADRVTQRYWLTVDEVEEKVVSGEWTMSSVDLEMLKGHATRLFDSTHNDPGLQSQKDWVVGESNTYSNEADAKIMEGFAPYNKNKVQVFRVFLRDAVEEGGPRGEVIYHIPYPLRKIVLAQHLDEEYPHGKRPFITAKYLPIAGRWAALGLGDQMAAINLEVNTIINYVNNNQELINNPFYFYEPTALTADTKALTSIRPGMGIPVMSVQGIMFPTFSQQPLANMEIMTSLLMFGDRLTISPMNSGSTQMKNAPRTARGTLAMLGEGHVKTDMLITRFQSGPWTELMEQLFGLYQEFMPDERWYYITRGKGEGRPNRVSKRMMRGRYEFVFKGNTVNTNKEVLRSMAQVRYNTLMTNPDYSTDPHVRRAAIKDFLKFWGEGTDTDRLVPALPGEGAYTHPPMSQQDECKILAMAVPVQVLPSDPHGEHLQVMDMEEKSTGFATMPQHAVGLWANHKLQHMEMLRSQMQQSTMPVAPGMGNNVPEGMSLAGGGNDMGVMEGGNMR